MKEANNNIPQHWEMKKLGEIGDIVAGGTPSTAIAEYWEGSISWISPADLSGYTEKFILKGRKSITESGLKNSSARIIPKGSVLFSSRAPIGYVVIAGKEVSTNQGFKSIVPTNKVSSDYLYHFLKASKQKAEKVASGTTFKEISLKAFSQLEIPLPPLPEQVAIVNKIEELFSELENGKEQLLTAQRQLKIYRQSLLKAAFEGRLTHDSLDLPDYPDSKSIPNTKSRKSLNQENQGADSDLPEGWKWVKSGELFDFVTSGSRGWARFYSESGAIFIRITNLDFDSLDLDLEESKIQYVNPPLNSEGIRTKVEEGDFLFSITGYLGMFAIAPKLDNAYVNQHVCLCRPKNGFIKKYVGYWIISKSGGHHYLNKNQKGAVKAGLTLDDIKNFPIPLPPLPVQQAIVEILESKLTVCDKLEETISHSLEQTETLRQSILKKAFEGKLYLD